MSNNALALFGQTELSDSNITQIAAKMGDAGTHLEASAQAIAAYNNAAATAERNKVMGYEKTAKTVALHIGMIRAEYKAPKPNDNSDKPTMKDIAKALTISPTYFSQLGQIAEQIYSVGGDTANALGKWFSPSTLIKLLPLKQNLLSECTKGISDGTLQEGMTQAEVKKWVDERITHRPEVEPVLVCLNPTTGERKTCQFSVYLDEIGLSPDNKVCSFKTGIMEELSSTLSLEWTAHVFKWDDCKGADVIWTRKHKISKEAKPDAVQPVDPIDVLRQSLRRAGYDEEAIEMVLAMNDK